MDEKAQDWMYGCKQWPRSCGTLATRRFSSCIGKDQCDCVLKGVTIWLTMIHIDGSPIACDEWY